MQTLLLYGWIFSTITMIVLWLYSLKSKDAGIVDVGWAFNLGTLAIFYAIAGDGDPTKRYVVGFLGGYWGLRLSYYLLTDRIIGKEEDGRYKALRDHWGDKANFNLFFFFQAQAILDVILSISFLALVQNSNPEFSLFEYLGIAVWLIAVIGESIADKQLANFRANPENKGKTCREGFWNYSRHPNYFFEWFHWISYALMGLSAPSGWMTFIAPVLMYFFITKFTGIPYTEIQALKSRGEDYRRYQRTTNALFPWFPKKES